MSPHPEASAALRNAGWVAAQRGLQIVIGVVFALLVPRLMGPEVFGEYALVTSVSLWFTLISGLGVASMMTRTVPGFVDRGDMAGLQKLVSSLLVLRVGTGVIAGALYLALTTFWLREVDIVALAFMAGSVFCRATGSISFALFLGLNQAGRWGFGEMLRRALQLIFVLLGFGAAGFRGACAGWFAANAAVLLAGLWMSRAYLRFRWTAILPDRQFLTPILRTGAYFAGGGILLSISERTGEALVHLTNQNFVEVGYFGVAYAMYSAGAQGLWHVAVAFAPVLILWNGRGEHQSSRQWVERLLAWMTVAAVMALIAVLLVGDLAVGTLFGVRFQPAARNLLPLAVAFLALAVGNIGRLQALVDNRPGVSAMASGIELVTFWATGLWLARGAGSFGACVAVLAGATLSAAYFTWRFRGERRYSLRPAALAVAWAVPVLPLALFKASWPVELLLLGVALAVYGAVLLTTRVVTLSELARFRSSLRRLDAPAA